MKHRRITGWLVGLAAVCCLSPLHCAAAETTPQATTISVQTTKAGQIDTGDAGVAVAAAALLTGLVTTLLVSGKSKDE